MPIKEIIDTAQSGTAWKTPSMRGFMFKTSLDAETYGEGAYTLTFRKAANSGGNPQDYVFYFNVSTSASAPSAANLILDKELLGHILSNNWQTGKLEDFEAARTGSGNW